MAIRLIALDIDGTLLTSAGEVSPAVRAAIRAAAARGVHITLATGRWLYAARVYAELLGFRLPLILHGGAVIQESATGAVLYEDAIPPDVLREAVAISRAHGYQPVLLESPAHGGRLYTGPETAENRATREYLITREGLARITFDTFPTLGNILSVAMFDDELPPLLILRDVLIAALGRRIGNLIDRPVTATASVKTFALDLFNAGCGKGKALAHLARQEGITLAETMVVGDYLNDLDQKGLPYLDKFTHRVIPDAQSLVNSLLSGDIDASIYPSPAGADKLNANKDLRVLVPPFTSPDGWYFSFKNPYLAKKEVRQAVAYALDMNQFSKDSLYGLGKPGIGPIAPGNFSFDKDLKPYPYDLDKAKALIKQAGTPPADISFITNKGNVLREDFLTYTQAQLDKIGWKIKPEAIEFATLIDRILKGDFDVEGVNSVGATVDPGELYDQFTTGSARNYAKYSNPQLDPLLKQAKQELDPQKQIPIYKQIQTIVMEDVPFHFAWYRPYLHVARKKFAGYVDSADTGGMFYELEQWYVNG